MGQIINIEELSKEVLDLISKEAPISKIKYIEVIQRDSNKKKLDVFIFKY